MSIDNESPHSPQSANSSIDHIQSVGSEFNHYNKSITLSLKLENEKLELEKYRKLVERELSKQHSIESIEIEGGRDKEKIIRICFESGTQKKVREEPPQLIEILPPTKRKATEKEKKADSECLQ